MFLWALMEKDHNTSGGSSFKGAADDELSFFNSFPSEAKGLSNDIENCT